MENGRQANLGELTDGLTAKHSALGDIQTLEEKVLDGSVR